MAMGRTFGQINDMAARAPLAMFSLALFLRVACVCVFVFVCVCVCSCLLMSWV